MDNTIPQDDGSSYENFTSSEGGSPDESLNGMDHNDHAFGYPATLQNLPTEMKIEIINYLPTRWIRNLALTCKDMASHCIPCYYRQDGFSGLAIAAAQSHTRAIATALRTGIDVNVNLCCYQERLLALDEHALQICYESNTTLIGLAMKTLLTLPATRTEEDGEKVTEFCDRTERYIEFLLEQGADPDATTHQVCPPRLSYFYPQALDDPNHLHCRGHDTPIVMIMRGYHTCANSTAHATLCILFDMFRDAGALLPESFDISEGCGPLNWSPGAVPETFTITLPEALQYSGAAFDHFRNLVQQLRDHGVSLNQWAGYLTLDQWKNALMRIPFWEHEDARGNISILHNAFQSTSMTINQYLKIQTLTQFGFIDLEELTTLFDDMEANAINRTLFVSHLTPSNVQFIRTLQHSYPSVMMFISLVQNPFAVPELGLPAPGAPEWHFATRSWVGHLIHDIEAWSSASWDSELGIWRVNSLS